MDATGINTGGASSWSISHSEPCTTASSSQCDLQTLEPTWSWWALDPHTPLTLIAQFSLSINNVNFQFVLVAFLTTSYADISLLRERERNRPPQNAYSSSGGDFLSAPRNTYIPPNNQYIPPSNQYIPPSNQYIPSSNTYLPPNQPKPSTTSKPVTQYLPPSKPSQTYLPAQNSYLPPSNKGPTTPPVPILKYVNELNEDGSYKYE